MGDGNSSMFDLLPLLVEVGTAVNPHGGWKLTKALHLLQAVAVGTAVNPHGGWKLYSASF